MAALTIHEARQDLETIFRAGLQRVDPMRMIEDHVTLEGDRLVAHFDGQEHVQDLSAYDRILILGCGKATAPMAKALESILGERISEGLIVVKYGHALELNKIRTVEAGHPVPDENGVRGAQELAQLAGEADERTLALTLVSGGGSALLPAPLACHINGRDVQLSLEDKQTTTRALLRCGASIQEINCIRKHLSALKGGRLLQLLAPAANMSFILSDVVGDDLSSIASGLTSSDPSTFGDALAIIERYGVVSEIPALAMEALRAGADGQVEETLKPGQGPEAKNILIGTLSAAMAAARDKAEALGYNVVCLTSRITGEAKETASFLAAVAADSANAALLAQRPACIISGGEPVVTLQGTGKGGRNQELALAYLLLMRDNRNLFGNVAFLSASTDGNDGPTDAAGAYADLELLKQAKSRGLDPAAFLRNNDSYHFFKSIDGLCITGPTNTNVCDLHFSLMF